ncbi:lipopolysaccharide biosynthesis protein [bacterium AH-315-F18]|nr:lipopolysaccharide biosynthesis protein [bacterium AH-315-F18]
MPILTSLWDSVRPNIRRLTGEMAAIAGGQFLAALAGLLGARIITEMVSPDVLGRASLLTGLAALASSVLITPYSLYAMRAFSESAKDNGRKTFVAYVRKVTGRLFLVGLLPFLALIYGFEWYRGSNDLLMVLLMLVFFVTLGWATIERSLLIADRLHVRASILTVAEKWLTLAGIVLGVSLLGDNTRGYYIGIVALLVPGLILHHLFLKPSYADGSAAPPTPAIADKWKHDAWKFALPLAPMGLIGWVTATGNRYVLAGLESDFQVGLFAICFGLVGQPFTLVGGTLSRFFRPIWFAANENGDDAKEQKIIVSYLLLSAAVAGLGVVLFYALEDVIINLLLAEPYRAGARSILLWLAGGFALHIMAWVFEVGLHTERKTRSLTVIQTISAATNISLCFYLIPRLGLQGVAYAIALTHGLQFLTSAAAYFLARRDRPPRTAQKT